MGLFSLTTFLRNNQFLRNIQFLWNNIKQDLILVCDQASAETDRKTTKENTFYVISELLR